MTVAKATDPGPRYGSRKVWNSPYFGRNDREYPLTRSRYRAPAGLERRR
jgi:hypothetical protein